MRTRNLVGLLLVALSGLINPKVAAVQLLPELPKEMWSAEWITSPEAPQRDQSVLHFRKAVELARRPQHFLVHVSADNQFIFLCEPAACGLRAIAQRLGSLEI
jgi:alpha-L-rhamnosidase